MPPIKPAKPKSFDLAELSARTAAVIAKIDGDAALARGLAAKQKRQGATDAGWAPTSTDGASAAPPPMEGPSSPFWNVKAEEPIYKTSPAPHLPDIPTRDEIDVPGSCCTCCARSSGCVGGLGCPCVGLGCCLIGLEQRTGVPRGALAGLGYGDRGPGMLAGLGGPFDAIQQFADMKIPTVADVEKLALQRFTKPRTADVARVMAADDAVLAAMTDVEDDWIRWMMSQRAEGSTGDYLDDYMAMLTDTFHALNPQGGVSLPYLGTLFRSSTASGRGAEDLAVAIDDYGNVFAADFPRAAKSMHAVAGLVRALGKKGSHVSTEARCDFEKPTSAVLIETGYEEVQAIRASLILDAVARLQLHWRLLVEQNAFGAGKDDPSVQAVYRAVAPGSAAWGQILSDAAEFRVKGYNEIDEHFDTCRKERCSFWNLASYPGNIWGCLPWYVRWAPALAGAFLIWKGYRFIAR